MTVQEMERAPRSARVQRRRSVMLAFAWSAWRTINADQIKNVIPLRERSIKINVLRPYAILSSVIVSIRSVIPRIPRTARVVRGPLQFMTPVQNPVSPVASGRHLSMFPASVRRAQVQISVQIVEPAIFPRGHVLRDLPLVMRRRQRLAVIRDRHAWILLAEPAVATAAIS